MFPSRNRLDDPGDNLSGSFVSEVEIPVRPKTTIVSANSRKRPKAIGSGASPRSTGRSPPFAEVKWTPATSANHALGLSSDADRSSLPVEVRVGISHHDACVNSSSSGAQRIMTSSQDPLVDLEGIPSGDYFGHPVSPTRSSEPSLLLAQAGYENYKPMGRCRRFLVRCWAAVFGIRPDYVQRLVHLGGDTRPEFFVANVVCNQKYNMFTFLPVVLFNQFRFFFNLFYLGVALLQFVPALKIGPIFTYLAPLSFVLFVTISREVFDDYKRYLRDKEANGTLYEILTPTGTKKLPASKIQVGDIIELHAKQRVPCDVVFLRSEDKLGTSFIRTDQLDGETDWKLRRPVSATQQLKNYSELLTMDAVVWVEAPRKSIYDFVGRFTVRGAYGRSRSQLAVIGDSARDVTVTTAVANDGNVDAEGLTMEHTMWANTVVTSGPIFALAIYTGKETRAALNTSKSKSKFGSFDMEVNLLSKILFAMLVVVAFILMIFRGLHGIWYLYFLRFILLLSSIIPISLRVNLDMAKSFYSWLIMRDERIPNTVVRTSTIPEELGRIGVLLSDKTGTLTQNDMVFKELHLGKAQFSAENADAIRESLLSAFTATGLESSSSREGVAGKMYNDIGHHDRHPNRRVEVRAMLTQTIVALGLCHNVTPVTGEDSNDITFQAASPDEVALVKFAASVGIRLVHRDQRQILLEVPTGAIEEYDILTCFPFSSETKRMGIIVRAASSGRLHFFMKGAESQMMTRLRPRGSHWLQEECSNFARRGLRTLVIAHKELSKSEYSQFHKRYTEAKAAMTQRAGRMRMVVESIEDDMDLLGLTGVEDKLQDDVPQTLEALRHAGVKIWMLTGDKAETATCIAISAGLKARQHSVTALLSDDVKTPHKAQEALEKFAMTLRESVLVVDGEVLAICLRHVPKFFFETACRAPAVVCCRCSPTQKADVVRGIREVTGYRTCAIGDGGNDVSMIQAADCGVGLVGLEGRQASLAADFSILQFRYIQKLLLWHGRNSYQRSAKLAQFVIHRGLIIAVIQAIFSAIFFFIPVAIFQGWLTVGYATYYTMWPVFSLVLDVELPESVVFMFPELYHNLKSGRDMSIKTFFCWVWKSTYQGAVIMMTAILLFEDRFMNIVSIAFTALILSELLNVASEITTWHPLMVVAEIVAIVVYLISMSLLHAYFDLMFIITTTFWFKVSIITLLSWLPVHIFKVVKKFLKPPQYSKLAT